MFSGLVGWFGWEHNGDGDHALLRDMVTAGRIAENVNYARDGGLLSARHALANFGTRSWMSEIPGVKVACEGRPIFSDMGLRDLAARYDPARAIAEAYGDASLRCLSNIQGPFSLAIIDEANDRLVCAVDRMGVHGLHIAFTERGIIFAKTIRALSRHPIVNLRVNKQGIYDFLFAHVVPAPSTVYHSIEKLPPAHYLVVQNGRRELTRYWMPKFGDGRRVAIGDMKQELFAVLRKSVKRSLDGRSAGAYLSGGLDSSTLSGMLSEVIEKPQTFSIGFSADGYDEMEFARAAAKHFGTITNEYYLTPEDIAQSVDTVAAAYDEPFGNSSAIPAYLCAREAAKKGETLLLAGDGGDELFAGNERYLKQQVFEIYGKLPSWIRKKTDSLGANQAIGSSSILSRKVHRYVAQAIVPLPDRLETYNVLELCDPASVFSEEFLRDIDRQRIYHSMREWYWAPDEATALDRMLYLDWKKTLADNDFRKVLVTAEAAGINVEFPFADDEAVEFSASIPSSLKINRGRLRHFYRHAMRGYLPQKVLQKHKHGFGLPFGVWLRSDPQLQEMVRESIDSLKSSGIFRTAFLIDLQEKHKHGHAGYFGELIWVFVMLSKWMQRN